MILVTLRYILAHLFSEVGDTFAHSYDYWDKWYHEIEIEKIFPLEESYGRVQILVSRYTMAKAYTEVKIWDGRTNAKTFSRPTALIHTPNSSFSL